LSPLSRLGVGVADSFALGALFLMLFQVSNEAVDNFAYFYAMIVGALKFVSGDFHFCRSPFSERLIGHPLLLCIAQLTQLAQPTQRAKRV
jgi:hypothetical protein